MSLTVRELKESETWMVLNENLSDLPIHRRVEPLLLLVTYLNNPHIRSITELFIKSGEFERDMDQFYVKFNYTEHVHKPESDLISCCSKIHSLLKQQNITVHDVIPLLYFFQKPIRGYW